MNIPLDFLLKKSTKYNCQKYRSHRIITPGTLDHRILSDLVKIIEQIRLKILEFSLNFTKLRNNATETLNSLQLPVHHNVLPIVPFNYINARTENVFV